MREQAGKLIIGFGLVIVMIVVFYVFFLEKKHSEINLPTRESGNFNTNTIFSTGSNNEGNIIGEADTENNPVYDLDMVTKSPSLELKKIALPELEKGKSYHVEVTVKEVN